MILLMIMTIIRTTTTNEVGDVWKVIIPAANNEKYLSCSGSIESVISVYAV